MEWGDKAELTWSTHGHLQVVDMSFLDTVSEKARHELDLNSRHFWVMVPANSHGLPDHFFHFLLLLILQTHSVLASTVTSKALCDPGRKLAVWIIELPTKTDSNFVAPHECSKTTYKIICHKIHLFTQAGKQVKSFPTSILIACTALNYSRDALGTEMLTIPGMSLDTSSLVNRYSNVCIETWLHGSTRYPFTHWKLLNP